MMKFSLVLLSMLSASVAFSADNRCKNAVEKQMPDLSNYAHAVRESKVDIIDRIEQGEIILKTADQKPVLDLLKRTGTLVFSFDLEDEAVYLTIVSSTGNCAVLYVAQTKISGASHGI